MLHIVTAYTRTPEYLKRIGVSMSSLTIEYKWFIVTTKDRVSSIPSDINATVLAMPASMPMHSGPNFYYDTIPDEGQWVYILDDDNLIHKNFGSVQKYMSDTECDMLVVGQADQDFIRYVCGIQGIAIQKIDNGQFFVRRSAVGKLRYWVPEYRADGYFATEMRILTMERKRKIVILPVVASYYNGQNWVKST